MLKKTLLAAAATAIVAGATLATPALAEVGMTCKDAAKAKFPDDRKMRHDYKKACKDAWKVSQGKTGILGKFKVLNRG